MNNLAISLKKFFTNKNTVTIIGVVAILVILYFLYTKTIKDKTQEIQVPVAAKTISPQTQITESDVTYVNVAKAAKPDKVLMNDNEIIGKYTGVGSTIPEGSMFYRDVIVEKEDLPGNWLTLLEADESTGGLQIPYYFSVNTTTTFGNSIQPGDYVDFYARTYSDETDKNGANQLMFGKLLSNVKILSVTDGEGKDVFRSTNDISAPAFLNFGLSKDNYELFKKADYLNDVDIEIIVVPHGGAVKEEDLKVNVSSKVLRDFIFTKAYDQDVIDQPLITAEATTQTNAEENNQ